MQNLSRQPADLERSHSINEDKESNSDEAAQWGAAVKLNDEMKGRTGETLLGVDARESHDRWPYTISSALF